MTLYPTNQQSGPVFQNQTSDSVTVLVGVINEGHAEAVKLTAAGGAELVVAPQTLRYGAFEVAYGGEVQLHNDAGRALKIGIVGCTVNG